MPRPVDDAMAADRPEKQTIRGLWVEEVRLAKSAAATDVVPCYLTLPGALGGDIAALVDAGVVEVTENRVLANPERLELVAVERSASAIIELQRQWPGLKILEQPLDALLHSTGMLTFPRGEHRQFFRAQVVNLDLDEPLEASIQNGHLTFPVLALVRKIATLHADPPFIDWTLCLTLHGAVSWERASDELACRFLNSNFKRDATFSEQARELLGDELHDAVSGDPTTVGVCERSPIDQQRVMMALVPKRIAHDALAFGWSVETRENLHYGGSENRAPMVTWVLRLRSDPRATTEPDNVYREALQGALERRGRIDTEGVLHRG